MKPGKPKPNGEVITAVQMRVEVCTYNARGELASRVLHEVGALESQITNAVDTWIKQRLPKPPPEKEG